MENRPSDPRRASTGELLYRLVDDLDAVAQKQIHLVKQEARENIHSVLAGGKVLGIGAALLLAAFVGMVMLIIALLGLLMPLWVAALATTLCFAAIGGAVAYTGLQQALVSPMANTRASLQEDAEWAKRRLRPSER